MLIPRVNWPEIQSLRREMNRLFETAFPRVLRQVAPSFPAMNIWTNDEGIMVTAEIPGIKLEDLDISVTGGKLTLSGSRTPADIPEGAEHHRQERSYGEFTRTFQLPFAVDSEKVEATYKSGVLLISLPRAEADKPRKITVQSA